VATSVHPARAGVQDALMEIPADLRSDAEGAVAPDYTRGSLVNACLANGRPNCGRVSRPDAAHAWTSTEQPESVGSIVVKNFF